MCPVNCFRPDPVCGVDGVTYWCGCQEAQCAGVKVAKLGFCEVAKPPMGYDNYSNRRYRCVVTLSLTDRCHDQ
ncbi:uncharacterized protein Pyn_13373 [Prunus yedoensis var. nudiflora]|uniref:Kazal-like domain-containing protein n=1 Tax=Prunus yedoensis var. nudiflora TaxID=2094558 RepID=A0A314UWT5_PRUYE|nr:uncharacterized protein Pyn_13373 [Prunus yedoensis var. nudiflora]